jgi:phenylacetate-CoA ligase
LRKNLHLRREELEEIQRKKLTALVGHAYENVVYFRRLFDSTGIKPEDIRTVSDLQYIPMTDKATMRRLSLSEKVASNIDIEGCLKIFTSGSTGMPAHLYFTSEDFKVLDMVYLRSFLENGLKFRYKRAFIMDPHGFETKRCWYHRLGLATYTNISCFIEPDEQIRILRDSQPDFIHGYPSSLKLIAGHILEKGENSIKPRLISTAAELLDKRGRELIHSAFGVEAYDRYAASEARNIAWECDKHNGYHINMDTLVVEFIRDGKEAKSGERGDIVITNLHSYAMPFIRYKIGDMGIPSGRVCPCGIELPLMEIIEGRDEDFIVLKGGKLISPMMVTGTLDHIPGIRQFRVIQEDSGTIVAVLVKGDGFMPETVQRVKNDLKDVLGGEMNIQCQVVEEIPRESSGKVRAVISKVI